MWAYVDEAYCKDWFYMAAAIAHGRQQSAFIETEFGDLLADVRRRLSIDPQEIHGYDLLQGEGPWSGVSIPERFSVAFDALEIIRESNIRFIIRGINREAQRRRYREAYDPYPLVLTQCHASGQQLRRIRVHRSDLR